MDEARIRIRQLSRAGLHTRAFLHAAGDTMSRAVPVGGAPPFWNTIDPSSQLITGIHFDAECFFDLAGQLQWEYLSDDVNRTADVLASDRGVQTLHQVTGGRPERSSVFRDHLRPHGIEQEVAVALRARTGEAWGSLRLNRGVGQDPFSSEELDVLCAVSPLLAAGRASRPAARRSPGAGLARRAGSRDRGRRTSRWSSSPRKRSTWLERAERWA